MSLPTPSILSRVTELIRARLAAALFDADDTYDVIINTPSGVSKARDTNSTRGDLNLFFYRFEPSGLFGDDAMHRRWHVRAYCMITAFSTAGTETIGEGSDAQEVPVTESEIDFRVLGEVLRHYHENPELSDNELGVYLRAILSPLSSDEINQIWSTQGDTAYRPSLLYEFTLIPIEPRQFQRAHAPLVAGGLSLDSRADMDARDEPLPPAGTTLSPVLDADDDDDDDDGWIPQIALLSATQEVVQTLSFALNAAPASVDIWIAGPANEQVNIVWQHSDRGTWRDIESPPPAATSIPEQTGAISQLRIDPQVDTSAVATVSANVPADAQARQYLLFAERNANGVPRRSNPLIVTIGDVWS